MKLTKIGNICGGQDGAIYKNYLFRFDEGGNCKVFNLNFLSSDPDQKLDHISNFTLDKADIINPHSNAVMFGSEFISETDEFPLLYTNIYNNYAGKPDPLKGVCCAYRVERSEDGFKTTLVQIIRVGFTEDPLWKSENIADVRPYGNFTIDTEKGVLYAFTMRTEDKKIRYFAFHLPRSDEGTVSKEYGVNCVVLKKEDVKEYFDCDYQYFIQGACFKNGKVFSTEGFSDSTEAPPAIRVIDTEKKAQTECLILGDIGITVEPELIDFFGESCLYSDCHGNLYKLEL